MRQILTQSLALAALALMALPGYARSEDLTSCVVALDAHQSRDFARAIRWYTACLKTGELTPESQSITLRRRGDAHSRLGDHDLAMQDFDAALRLDPSDPISFVGRGQAYSRIGEHDEAINDFTSALVLEPEYTDALGARGREYFTTGNNELAIRDYGGVLRLEPDNVVALSLRGVAWFAQAQYGRALTDFERAVALDREDAYAMLWSYLSRARGEVGGGLEELAASAKHLPDNLWLGSIVDYQLGEISAWQLISRTDDPQARSELLCQAFFYIGQSNLIRGNIVTAANNFERAIRTNATGLIEYVVAEMELTRLSEERSR